MVVTYLDCICNNKLIIALLNIRGGKKCIMEVERIHKEVEAQTTKGQTDSWELAKLVCFYYELCDVRDAIKSLIIDALTIYQGDNSWELKIKLINKCNVTSGVRPQNLLLGPGPKAKSQGTGLKNMVTIVRNAG